MRTLREYDQSRFWQRLEQLSRGDVFDKAAVNHLKSSVRKVANCTKWISTQICRTMPQYTLHDERHFLNVLGIMDALVPDDVMQRLTPLEFALPILAAYTHDLGMALSEEEKDNLFDESTEKGKHFASYRTRFNEELRQIDRSQKRRDESPGEVDLQSPKNRIKSQFRNRQSKIPIGALELRELRRKMKQAGAREPIDGELVRPGSVHAPDRRKNELRATLNGSTGEATAQQRLRVTDDGLGMTEAVNKRYFTQFDKCYDRSHEFNQERAAKKADGEVVSPSSMTYGRFLMK